MPTSSGTNPNAPSPAQDDEAARKIVPFPDPVLIENLFEQHYQNLKIFALSLTRNEADACDLAQETFRRFAVRGSQLRDHGKAKSWLYTTLYRAFLDHKRKHRRDAEMPENVDEWWPDETAPSGAETARNLDHRQVHTALAKLPEKYRLPLTLFYLQDCSYKEIAKILGLRLGTVMSRLSRGKDKLADQLTDFAPENR